MSLSYILAGLAALSLLLLFWQWVAAVRFPLHRRDPRPDFAPPLSLLKPLKGCDEETENCLRSWLRQEYPGQLQFLFAVTDAADPAYPLVQKLLAEYPHHDAQVIVCSTLTGANAKVSKLAQLERLAKHAYFVVSDADVFVPPDFLRQLVQPFRAAQTGLVHCFYLLANPGSLALRWEAVAINADFWSQVLQSRTLKPVDFALGAVMALRRDVFQQNGGFTALVDYLADDYKLGQGIAHAGKHIEFCPVVVECRSAPHGWADVWTHQLRWARTIRLCQPVPYFFSILSNATLWPLLWLLARPGKLTLSSLVTALVLRMALSADLQRRLTGSGAWAYAWLAPVKDILQFGLWLMAFAGNEVVWRGQRYQTLRGGKLIRM